MSSSTKYQRLAYTACAVVAVAAVIAAGRWGCSSHEQNKFPGNAKLDSAQSAAGRNIKPLNRSTRPEGDYAGNQACSECHARVEAAYHGHPMSRSIAPIAEVQDPHEDYLEHTSFSEGFSEFRVERQGDRVWHHEIVKDHAGVIFDQSEEIQYALGSGTHGRSYLMWREDALYISPISWYANKGWGPSPQKRQHRFHRRVIDTCLHCHSGRYVELDGQSNLYPQPVFHEMSIGCEQCHGPGKAHIDYRRSAEALTADPIVNPGKLPGTERDAVCNQCHLVGEMRFLRYGLKDSDFRPGQKLSDVWVYFLKGNKTQGKVAEAVSQALQMYSSQCYIKSNGRLGCISCHDAHSILDRSNTETSYREKCLNCHAERGCSLNEAERHAESVNDSCTHCHMQPLSAKGIPHTSLSDHRILRRPDQPKKSTGQEELHIYVEDGATVPPEELTRARALMLAQTAEANGDRKLALKSLELLLQSLPLTPDDEALLESLGAIYAILGNTFEAESSWKRILERNPRRESALLRLANSAHDQRRYPQANEYFTKLVNVHGWQAIVRGRYSDVLGHLGKQDEAIVQGKLALEIDPLMLPIYDWLSQCYSQSGDRENAWEIQAKGRRLRNQLNR